jgi:hypothetical protein
LARGVTPAGKTGAKTKRDKLHIFLDDLLG